MDRVGWWLVAWGRDFGSASAAGSAPAAACTCCLYVLSVVLQGGSHLCRAVLCCVLQNKYKYSGVQYVKSHDSKRPMVIHMSGLGQRTPYRHDADKFCFICKAASGTWTAAACSADIIVAMSRDIFQSHTNPSAPEEDMNFDIATQHAVSAHKTRRSQWLCCKLEAPEWKHLSASGFLWRRIIFIDCCVHAAGGPCCRCAQPQLVLDSDRMMDL